MSNRWYIKKIVNDQ
ncbi:Protein of unknown function [Bacillus cereus]|nr:Protein of unknown function [Bacillus cereus]SCN41157.1 Protein of unknown function [Bacillus wiedmannii]